MLALALVLVACGTDDDRVALSVFAASSLTEAFTELEQAFEVTRPDVDVQLTFAGSQVLRMQLEQGATADVFASANEGHMDALVSAGVVSRSETFTHNELVVIIPTDNPAGLTSFESYGPPCSINLGSLSSV